MKWGIDPITMSMILAYLNSMPQKKSKTYEVQILAGIYSSRAHAHAATRGIRDLDIPPQDLQMVVELDSQQKEEAFMGAVAKAIRDGKIVGSVHNAARPASLMEVSSSAVGLSSHRSLGPLALMSTIKGKS